jgi:hypothetical protein
MWYFDHMLRLSRLRYRHHPSQESLLDCHRWAVLYLDTMAGLDRFGFFHAIHDIQNRVYFSTGRYLLSVRSRTRRGLAIRALILIAMMILTCSSTKKPRFPPPLVQKPYTSSSKPERSIKSMHRRTLVERWPYSCSAFRSCRSGSHERLVPRPGSMECSRNRGCGHYEAFESVLRVCGHEQYDGPDR